MYKLYFFIFLCIKPLFSQILINDNFLFLKDVKIISETVKNKSFYYYTYKFINAEANKGKIVTIDLDISRNNLSIDFDTADLKFSSNFEEKSFRRVYPLLSESIISCSPFKLPKYWTGIISNNLNYSFNVFRNYINPADSIDGFTMQSKAIPGIRKIKIEPVFNQDRHFLSSESNEADTIQNPVYVDADSILDMISYKGFTVGPVAPPKIFNAAVFIDTLISYKNQSVSFGWLTNRGIEKSLGDKLENAKKQFQNGNSHSAKNILQAFINEVEAQKEKNLSNEAFALLKYNAEYIVEQLGSKK